MSDRLLDRSRWVFLAVAVALLVVYIVAQEQHGANVSYARSPSGSAKVTEGGAGELTDTTLPSVGELTEMVAASPVVRLPGSVAFWDERRVARAIGDADIRILVAPPGLSKAQREQLGEVENATIRVVGTDVTSGFGAVSDDLAGWRGQFVTGDVTGLLLALVAAERELPQPADVDLVTWRAPTEAELGVVAADVRAGRAHVAEGATLESVPENAGTAFPGVEPVVAAFPQQPFGVAVADYGPALAELFPGRPVVVMYGNWISYSGPQAAEFADVAAGGFYGRFGERLSKFAYPQYNVLNVYLDGVTDVRYAGLFDRPLPYEPFDPLRVALPALPWLFAACVLVFLVVSVRSSSAGRVSAPVVAESEFAGLTSLAIELSALSHDRSLTRALTNLESARAAVADELPGKHVRKLLAVAESDLDVAARKLGRPEYRPARYLDGGGA